MIKHTDEFLQFAKPVTCREYTLPRDEKSADPKGWIQGNTKIGPVLEVTTSYLQSKHGVDIRIESVNNDNLTRGSEFLMAWTNWSQTWSTRSTTTTSKRPLQRRRKYLRLQAPKLKQNREDHQLLAHFQRLSSSWKKMDWYWTKNSDRSSLPSGKKNEHSSSTLRVSSRRRWCDRILETDG